MPKCKYFIGRTPAKDVPPPNGGWTVFEKGTENRNEIVRLLLAEYEDAIAGAAEPPEPHVFFNEHNHLCRIYNYRHFTDEDASVAQIY
jgi:hypothetical protein